MTWPPTSTTGQCDKHTVCIYTIRNFVCMSIYAICDIRFHQRFGIRGEGTLVLNLECYALHKTMRLRIQESRASNPTCTASYFDNYGPKAQSARSHYERPAHARKKLCCKQTRTHSCPHIHYVTFCNRGELAKGIEEGWWANPSRVQRRKLRRWSPPPRKTLSKVFIHIRGKGEQRLRSLQQNRAGSDGVEIDAKGRGILPSAPFLDLLERDS